MALGNNSRSDDETWLESKIEARVAKIDKKLEHSHGFIQDLITQALTKAVKKLRSGFVTNHFQQLGCGSQDKQKQCPVNHSNTVFLLEDDITHCSVRNMKI
jgi:hypothetical protein